MDIDPYRVLVEHATEVAFVADLQGQLTWVSPSLPRVLGWDPDSLIGASLRGLVHPEDAWAADAWREALLGPTALGDGGTSDPLRFRRADGAYRWCSVTVTRIHDDDGRWAGTVGTLHDVDALVRARIDAAEAHARLRSVLAAQVEPHVTLVAVRDRAGAIVDFAYEDANVAAAAFHRLTPDVLVGRTLLEVLGLEAGTPDLVAGIEVLASGQAKVWNDVWSQVRQAQGEPPTWLDIRIAPVDAERVSYSWRDVTERYSARMEVARAHDLLRAVIDAQLDPHVIVRAVRDGAGTITDFTYVDANRAAADFEGVPRDSLVGSTIRAVYRHIDEALEDIADCARALETGAPVVRNDSRTLGYVDAEGRPVVADIRVVPIGDDQVSYTWRDVTARHLAQQRLAESEERFRLLAENMTDVVILIRDQCIVWVSPSVTRSLGWRPEQLVGRSPAEVTDPRDAPAVVDRWLAVPAGELPRQRYRMLTPEGDVHWVDAEGSIIGTHDGRTVVVTARIVDAEVEALVALEDKARHDELTGLVNRHEVFDQVQRSLTGSIRTGTRVAMVFCDLDGFKSVNDSYGHSGGDMLLRAIARRLEAAVRSGDVVARIGGDELLVVLNGVRDLEDAMAIGEKLRAEVAQPTAVHGGTVTVSASVGVTLAEPGESVDDIVARADAAMYAAKRSGKDAVVAVDGAMVDVDGAAV